MIDFKRTIIKLHEQFPEWDIDTLIKVISAVEEILVPINTPIYRDINKDVMYENKPWYTTEITCNKSTSFK